MIKQENLKLFDAKTGKLVTKPSYSNAKSPQSVSSHLNIEILLSFGRISNISNILGNNYLQNYFYPLS
jgi:hypothetical protein